LIVVENTEEEVAGGKAKSILEEGRKHHNFFGVGCWDLFPFGMSPLEHHMIREEVVLN
jgi:hypothetical protein